LPLLPLRHVQVSAADGLRQRLAMLSYFHQHQVAHRDHVGFGPCRCYSCEVTRRIYPDGTGPIDAEDTLGQEHWTSKRA
jgi:hypothetical protein